MTWQIGNTELDNHRFELRRNGKVLALEPRALKLLVYLAECRGRAVSRSELMEQIWSGIAVTQTSLNQAVLQIRQALGEQDRVHLKTIRGRGYLLEKDQAALTQQAS